MTTLRKVLVVDDDPVVGRSFDRVLSKRGYAVVTAGDGAEALRKIAAEEYDVVFTDIRMPGIDGISVAERIRDRQPWLPVVIVSGYATSENEARARAAGVSAVLHKPLSPEMIEDSARDALLRRDAEPSPATRDAAAALPATDAPLVTDAWSRTPARLPGFRVWAPLLGLLYVLVLPFAGLAALVAMPFWYGARALARGNGRAATWLRNVALFVAAPVIGLVYVVALPFVGIGMLAWMGVKAVTDRADAA